MQLEYRFATGLCGAAFLLAGAVAAFPQEVQRPSLDPRLNEIRGVVRIQGCAPEASAFDLRAMPLGLATGQREQQADPRVLPIAAEIAPTLNRHVFDFRIRGLRPATLYQLAISLPPSPVCPKVFWRNASRGLAVSGGEPVLIEGLGVSSRIEVFQASTDQWVGADQLDFTDPATARRRLQWRSELPDLVGGELQISTTVFPTRGNFGACDEPDEGVIYRQAVPAVQDQWTELGPIDFNAIISRRVGGLVDTTGPSDATLRLLELGAPIYARVVPITTSGRACDITDAGAPGWVVFSNVPKAILDAVQPPADPPILEAGSGHVYAPPFFNHASVYQPETVFPRYGDNGYRVVKPHPLASAKMCELATTAQLWAQGVPLVLIPAIADPLGCALVNSNPGHGGTTLNPGFRFSLRKTYSTAGSTSWYDVGFELVTGVGSAAAFGVSGFASLYNGVVDGVKGLAYDALSAAIPLCQSYPNECKTAISVGMTYGMTAMGLPPSLPNWDELKEEGVEYLATQVGDFLEQETGLPSEVGSALTQAALKQMAQQAVDQMTANRGTPDPVSGWVVSDIGFAPASWTVNIVKHGFTPTPIDVRLFGYKNSLFNAPAAGLPHRFPPRSLPFLSFSTLRIPLVLQPNVDDIPAPFCRTTFGANHPSESCVGILPPGSKPICLTQYGTSWVDDPDCSTQSDLVAIYYRDAWAAKLATVKCTGLSAVTLAHGPASSVWIPWPKYTFNILGLVPPTIGGTWDGGFINACPQ